MPTPPSAGNTRRKFRQELAALGRKHGFGMELHTHEWAAPGELPP